MWLWALDVKWQKPPKAVRLQRPSRACLKSQVRLRLRAVVRISLRQLVSGSTRIFSLSSRPALESSVSSVCWGGGLRVTGAASDWHTWFKGKLIPENLPLLRESYQGNPIQKDRESYQGNPMNFPFSVTFYIILYNKGILSNRHFESFESKRHKLIWSKLNALILFFLCQTKCPISGLWFHMRESS